ncbi:helix-turn-helix domain-containing protein [Intestinibacillus massiliensis]
MSRALPILQGRSRCRPRTCRSKPVPPTACSSPRDPFTGWQEPVAIKEARKAKGISRNQLADRMNIAPRYITSIENSGQHSSMSLSPF